MKYNTAYDTDATKWFVVFYQHGDSEIETQTHLGPLYSALEEVESYLGDEPDTDNELTADDGFYGEIVISGHIEGYGDDQILARLFRIP